MSASEKLYDGIDTDFPKILRSFNLKITPKRLALLNILMN